MRPMIKTIEILLDDKLNVMYKQEEFIYVFFVVILFSSSIVPLSEVGHKEQA